MQRVELEDVIEGRYYLVHVPDRPWVSERAKGTQFWMTARMEKLDPGQIETHPNNLGADHMWYNGPYYFFAHEIKAIFHLPETPDA